ncbi:F-box protein At5g03100-like [Magnolia sinica]|uniref:F-box protein At5g03100-like n=1 Tax=Magnolia sinica TaxID=86752 RepID=UPI00265B5726|nr:F-box protein At5g03100-like [Magnolia sinica]
MLQDRISDLPDSLIHEILSHLEMKDVVKTCVLSTRWKHVWTQISVLNFKQRHHIGYRLFDRSVEDFFRFVCCSLALHKCPKIHRIRLSIQHPTREGNFCNEQIHGLIHFAIARKARELKLDISYPYVLNLSLLEMGSLEVLKLHLCTLKLPPPAFKGFKNLKTMSLLGVSFNGGNVGELLACCPILESLTVIDCHDDIRIHVSSSNRQLKHLSLKGEHKLDICAPNLLSLDISMPINTFNYSLVTSSSQTNVCLDLYLELYWVIAITISEVRVMQKILKDVHRARVLELYSTCIQVLSMCELEQLSSPISMHKCLVLNSALGKWELPGIACLLRSSPDLESLLDQTFMDKHEYVIEGYLESQFSCLLHHLKTIKISGFTKGMFRINNSKNKIKLVKVLLKHAVVLEKMTIQITHIPNYSCDKVNLSRLLLKLERKFQAFKKASTHAEILFSYDFDE